LSPDVPNVFTRHEETNRVCATAWFEGAPREPEGLLPRPGQTAVNRRSTCFDASHGLVTAQEEHELSLIRATHPGSSSRGAGSLSRTVGVRAASIGRALDYRWIGMAWRSSTFRITAMQISTHPGPRRFGIPWLMVTDGDEGRQVSRAAIETGLHDRHRPATGQS
jgi:hypothetical protein